MSEPTFIEDDHRLDMLVTTSLRYKHHERHVHATMQEAVSLHQYIAVRDSDADPEYYPFKHTTGVLLICLGDLVEVNIQASPQHLSLLLKSLNT